MVRQCVDCSNLDFIRLQPTNKVKSFDCGNEDLNDYITNRAPCSTNTCLQQVIHVLTLTQNWYLVFYSTFILTHSLRYLNGNGITVNCSFLTKDTFINVKSLSKNSGALPYGSIVRILAAL